MFDDTVLSKEIEACYLDNTYLHEQFEKIPTRDQALQEIINHISQARAKSSEKLVFFIKLKKLGKEELVIALYNHFQTPLLTGIKRYNRYVNVIGLDKCMFKIQPDPDSFILIEDEDLHENEKIVEFLNNMTVYTIEPTALHIKQKRNLNDRYVKIPYTDHSSYKEILAFIKKLRPKKIVPIVRQMLPNNIDTTNIQCLSKFLSKKPAINGVQAVYKLLLKSSTLVNVSMAMMNSIQFNKKCDTPVNSRSISRLAMTDNTSTPCNKKRMLDVDKVNLTPIPIEANNITHRRVLRPRSMNAKGVQYEETPDKKENIESKSLDSSLKLKNSESPLTPRRQISLPIPPSKVPTIYKLRSAKVIIKFGCLQFCTF